MCVCLLKGNSRSAVHPLLTHGQYKNTIITEQLAGSGSPLSLTVPGYRWHPLPFGKPGWLPLSCSRLHGREVQTLFPQPGRAVVQGGGCVVNCEPGKPDKTRRR